MSVDELVAQINKEYEKNKEPDKDVIISEIFNIFRRLKPIKRKSYSIPNENVNIHEEIHRLRITMDPNDKEKELIITYDSTLFGVELKFLGYDALVALKEKIPDILKYMLEKDGKEIERIKYPDYELKAKRIEEWEKYEESKKTN